MRLYVLNDAGEPERCHDPRAWAQWFESADEQRQLADDYVSVEGGVVVRVSTVFLGIDHSLSGEGAPWLWEMMIFGGDLHGHSGRYRSRLEALAGHREALALVLSEAQ